MSRRCMVTGKGAQVGHKVSHANNKTKRRFMPGVKNVRLYSEALGRAVAVKVTTHGIRSIEHKGGHDAWLIKTAPTKLDASLRPVKAEIQRKLGDKAKLAKKPAAKKAKAPARPKKAATAKKAAK